MKKKFFVMSALLIALSIMSASFVFANTNMLNTVEKAAENVTSDIGNTLNRGMGATANTINDGTRKVENTMVSGTTNNNNKTNNYNATRTNTNNTLLGMTPAVWTWLIMGMVAVAIVALVWYFAKQKDVTSNSNE